MVSRSPDCNSFVTSLAARAPSAFELSLLRRCGQHRDAEWIRVERYDRALRKIPKTLRDIVNEARFQRDQIYCRDFPLARAGEERSAFLWPCVAVLSLQPYTPIN